MLLEETSNESFNDAIPVDLAFTDFSLSLDVLSCVTVETTEFDFLISIFASNLLAESVIARGVPDLQN